MYTVHFFKMCILIIDNSEKTIANINAMQQIDINDKYIANIFYKYNYNARDR